jgi:uncharacterized membrane protein
MINWKTASWIFTPAFALLLFTVAIRYYWTPSEGKGHGVEYDFTTLDEPLGSFGTRALGVNSGGDIVGSNGKTGFLIKQGKSSIIHVEGSLFDEVSAINSSGIIAGTYSDTKHSRAFIYDGKTYTTIEPPAVTYTEPPQQGSHAYGINELGHVVGIYQDDRGMHGFLYDGSKHIALDYPGATETFARGVNAFGQIVGSYRTNHGKFHGFVYDGNYSTLDYPGGAASHTRLQGINDRGEIVGYCSPCDPKTGTRGFLFKDGEFVDVQFPGSPGTFLNGINNERMIVGEYNGIDGGHAFYAVPSESRR